VQQAAERQAVIQPVWWLAPDDGVLGSATTSSFSALTFSSRRLFNPVSTREVYLPRGVAEIAQESDHRQFSQRLPLALLVYDVWGLIDSVFRSAIM
jgi:hypothetical protein